MPGDYDGNRKTDLMWYMFQAGDGTARQVSWGWRATAPLD
jgi:hypothetical protein